MPGGIPGLSRVGLSLRSPLSLRHFSLVVRELADALLAEEEASHPENRNHRLLSRASYPEPTVIVDGAGQFGDAALTSVPRTRFLISPRRPSISAAVRGPRTRHSSPS